MPTPTKIELLCNQFFVTLVEELVAVVVAAEATVIYLNLVRVRATVARPMMNFALASTVKYKAKNQSKQLKSISTPLT